MSLMSSMDNFFKKYGEFYDYKPIIYTRSVVENIKNSNILKDFLGDNNISVQVLLNELIPYSQYKYTSHGDEKLNMDEMQIILNIIIFSNELEKLMIEGHIKFSSIGDMGNLYYVANKYASNYFNEKYDINIIEGEEFDFGVLDGGDSENNHNILGLN